MYHDPELGNAMSCLGMAPELVAVPNLITLCAEQLPMDVCMQVCVCCITTSWLCLIPQYSHLFVNVHTMYM